MLIGCWGNVVAWEIYIVFIDCLQRLMPIFAETDLLEYFCIREIVKNYHEKNSYFKIKLVEIFRKNCKRAFSFQPRHTAGPF